MFYKSKTNTHHNTINTMAPRKNTAAKVNASVFEEDVLDIEKLYVNEAPSEGAEADIGEEGHLRRYRFTDGSWKFEGTFKDDSEAAPVPAAVKPKAEKKAKKPKAPVAPIIEDSGAEGDSNTEEPTDEEDKPKKEKKPRAALNLASVMDALNDNKVDQAKKLLQRFIDKHGVEGKQRRATKAAAAEGEVPEKKLNEYQLFVSSEMKRLVALDAGKAKDDPTRIEPKDRMRVAMAAWKEHKAKKEAV